MRFLHPAVIRPQREKILSTNACDAGADTRSSASGQMRFVNGHLLRPELNSIITDHICLGRVRYAASKLALNGFLVSDHGQCSSRCNLFARKLNFLARDALPLMSIAAAVASNLLQ